MRIQCCATKQSRRSSHVLNLNQPGAKQGYVCVAYNETAKSWVIN